MKRMFSDKIKIYFLEYMLLIILFITLFVSNAYSRIILSLVLFAYAIITKIFIKRKSIKSIHSREITFLMIFLAIIYLGGFYLTGIYFGFYKSTVQFSFSSIFYFIMPYAIIIISSELLRNSFISQKIKFSKWISFISMVLIDILIYVGNYDLSNLDNVLSIIGFVVSASIACNLLYDYISKRYGAMPVIVYRLITVLYMYIIPVIPDMFIFMRSVLRVIYPYLIYILLEYGYGKRVKITSIKSRKISTIITGVMVTVSILFTMLISCNFKYGMIVIGSGSMEGAIDTGDAIVYTRYEGQTINNGDIIIFNKENTKIVHRVVDKKIVNGEYRYYTKGDANVQKDNWYVTNKEIVGINNFNIKYIGYPTLWINDIFSRK